MDILFLGLGNPPAYRGTRHNIGKDLVEGLVYEGGGTWRRVANGRVGCLLLGPHVITCMVSDGFMNETGSDMRDALIEIDPSRLVIVHDEIDLPVGAVRLSQNKSPGGHKGVASVVKELNTNAFFRLRIGVGRGRNPARYVLEAVPRKDVDSIVTALHTVLPDIILHRLLVPQT